MKSGLQLQSTKWAGEVRGRSLHHRDGCSHFGGCVGLFGYLPAADIWSQAAVASSCGSFGRCRRLDHCDFRIRDVSQPAVLVVLE